ncbi:VPLPA-CTERM sorting domain-containing protein [Rhodobacter sp. Har01]|uniref:VPLPA-CTERM sorting domain-containing protein n=1 Tax=Rhodobacter sp. Har01 TaxID=2883999 RepID=UPI001D0772EE|nr:VPLPA-CTERM sorting domain-containing protein [Rhodobacter sp. Har01]MCB6177055.1 VPLPA-CTERM sorting domain-containing protein [Rhodobacter sp. Har01]
MGLLSQLKTCAAAAAVLATTSVAAIAATFSGSFALSGDAFSDPGLEVSASPMSGSGSFDLDVGESLTFDLFDIWTNEESVNWDDMVPNSINVAFTMTQPVASGTATGTTVGQGFVWQWGSVNWGAPLQIAFGNGGLLQIALSDETFNLGWFGLNEGPKKGATVQATATYVSAPAPVPLPAGGLLLLGAMGAFAVVRRRKSV